MDIYIGRDNKEYGPYPLEKIIQFITEKKLHENDFVWFEGLEKWDYLKNTELNKYIILKNSKEIHSDNSVSSEKKGSTLVENTENTENTTVEDTSEKDSSQHSNEDMVFFMSANKFRILISIIGGLILLGIVIYNNISFKTVIKKYDALGKIKSEYGVIKKGKNIIWNGPYQSYFANGKVAEKGSYLQNKKNGKWEEFNDIGTVVFAGEYFDGEKKGVWRKYVDGILWKDFNYLEGQPNGVGQTYYENGKVFQVGNYTNGKETGIWTTYNRINGIEAYDYYSWGKIIKSFTYSNGYLKSIRRKDGCTTVLGENADDVISKFSGEAEMRRIEEYLYINGNITYNPYIANQKQFINYEKILHLFPSGQYIEHLQDDFISTQYGQYYRMSKKITSISHGTWCIEGGELHMKCLEEIHCIPCLMNMPSLYYGWKETKNSYEWSYCSEKVDIKLDEFVGKYKYNKKYIAQPVIIKWNESHKKWLECEEIIDKAIEEEEGDIYTLKCERPSTVTVNPIEEYKSIHSNIEDHFSRSEFFGKYELTRKFVADVSDTCDTIMEVISGAVEFGKLNGIWFSTTKHCDFIQKESISVYYYGKLIYGKPINLSLL